MLALRNGVYHIKTEAQIIGALFSKWFIPMSSQSYVYVSCENFCKEWRTLKRHKLVISPPGMLRKSTYFKEIMLRNTFKVMSAVNKENNKEIF